MQRPILKVQLDEGAFLPQRAHDTDAGADILTPMAFMLPARGSVTIHTGVHIQLLPGTAGLLVSKSGLNVNNGIVSDGLIDEGYGGEIVVKLYNLSDNAHVFKRGEKITQLVIVPVLYADILQVDRVQGGPRGNAGFGSTGR